MSLYTQTQVNQQLNQTTQQIDLQYLLQCTTQAQNQVQSPGLLEQLALHIVSTEGKLFQNSLKVLESLIKKGYSTVLLKHVDLLKKMMTQFIKWSQQLQKTNSNPNTEFRMINLLSLIAEIIRQNPKFYFPFTKRFLLAVFQIDYDLLKESPYRNDILAILSVLYQNLSKQGRLLNKYKMAERLKKTLFENYSLIEQLFSLKSSNRAIFNLARLGVKIQSYEFQKYQIFQTLAKFIQDKLIKVLALKLKSIKNRRGQFTGKSD